MARCLPSLVLGLAMVSAACSSHAPDRSADEPSTVSDSLPGRPADTPTHYERFTVSVTRNDKPVRGATIRSLIEGRTLGATRADGRATVWAPYDDTLLALDGEGPEAPAGVVYAGLEAPPYEIELEPPRVAQGVVRCEGQPVAGARVTLRMHPAYTTRSPRREGLAQRESPALSAGPLWARPCDPPAPELRIAGGFAQTDDRGRFRLLMRVPEAVGGLVACAPGRVPHALGEPATENFTSGQRLELELLPIRLVRGRVENTAGEPIAEVRIEVQRLGFMGLEPRTESVLVTDDEGGFVYDQHPEVPIDLVITRGENVTTTHLDLNGPDRVRIVLPEP